MALLLAKGRQVFFGDIAEGFKRYADLSHSERPDAANIAS
jgi:hypothetical protein